jgi:NTP pyrophosphatase (non-canonical NTP hydrolase)
MMEDKRFIKAYLDFIGDICRKHNWDKGWSKGGCYMHLEVSEFIEALRGKGDPEDELGDVLFTVLAVADYYKIDVIKALERNIKKHKRIIANEKDK